MSDFKIGQKVRYKNSSNFLGYVSHVHKGYLFHLSDYEIDVHLGNQKHTIVKSSELTHFENKD